MRQYEALFMVTVFQGSNILSNSLSAVIVLEEMDGEPWWKLAGYFLCIGGMIVGLLVLTSGEDLIKASHSNGQLEPLSSPRMSPVEDVAEDTASLVDSSDSEPPAFMDFVHAVAKDPFEHALCRQVSEDASLYGTPGAFDRPREVSLDYVDYWFLNGLDSGPLTYQWRCKMCADFIGYQADVVVMDCWPGGTPERKSEITEARKHEWDGWVLIIARTDRGHDVVESAKAAGLLSLAPAESMEVLTTQPHQARRAGSNFIRRTAHAQLGQPLTALDPAAAARVARWALDKSFMDEVLRTGKPAPEAPEAAKELRAVLGPSEPWAEALLQLPQEHLAYHWDNYKGAKKRLERGDAVEAAKCEF
eukprot:s2465_g11.t1